MQCACVHGASILSVHYCLMVSLHKPGLKSIPGLLKRFKNLGSEILEQSMGTSNQVVVPARYIDWRNQFLGIDSWAP